MRIKRLAATATLLSLTFATAASAAAIIITPVMYFGLLDGQNYLDYDGHGGHYVYNPANGIITMTDGSLHGVKYKKVADWSFRKLDDSGKETSFTCPYDAKKDPRHRPW